jgi:glycolate dehydrogenase FAD-binding subunit
MGDSLKPSDARAVEQAVEWALCEGKTMEIVGAGSKRAIGRPTQTDLTLDLSALTGITLYEPEELVLSARAGTPLVEIETLLESKGQQLAFEPMDCGPLLGGTAGRGTIGGTLATNLSGPRRIKAGAARDHFLGFHAVSGRGETFKSGGRVVKNVTGYDLCKLMAGSWGTLAALTDVTIKTLPKPESEATVLIRGLEPPSAIAAMTSAMASGCDVSGAAHLPEPVAARIPVAEITAAGAAVTALRLEGFAPSVAHRKRILGALLKPFGELGEAPALVSHRLWQAVRDATPFAAGNANERALWRLSVPASRGAELAARIAEQAQAHMLFDWAGGLVWLALEACDDAGAAVVARALAATGGHATLIRAATSVRATIDVFSRQDRAITALTKRVKEGFDPKGVLNPGRMWAGL